MDNYRERRHNQVWWYRPVIAATEEAKAGGFNFKAFMSYRMGLRSGQAIYQVSISKVKIELGYG